MLPLISSVTVTTGARLHFGLLVRGETPVRNYGGLGLMIDRPGFTVTVRSSSVDRLSASPSPVPRLVQILSALRSSAEIPPCEIAVDTEIPAHTGLGSGTQLSLAVTAAISRWLEWTDESVRTFAHWTGRGNRSAIGTAGFSSGGLIVDDGRPGDETSVAVTARHDFPGEWRIVLVTPPADRGLSGDSERHAFRQLAAMPSRQLVQLEVLMRRLPEEVRSRNFTACGATLYEFGQSVGEYFAPIQGGVYASPRMASLAGRLRASGVIGVGQTSWGPTLFALCDGESSAESVMASIGRWGDWNDCLIRSVAPMNHGARIVTAYLSGG